MFLSIDTFFDGVADINSIEEAGVETVDFFSIFGILGVLILLFLQVQGWAGSLTSGSIGAGGTVLQLLKEKSKAKAAGKGDKK